MNLRVVQVQAAADAPCGNAQGIFIEIGAVGLSGMPRYVW